MTADQVRWKINALTKKYKRCINTGQSIKFKYFKEMDDIMPSIMWIVIYLF